MKRNLIPLLLIGMVLVGSGCDIKTGYVEQKVIKDDSRYLLCGCESCIETTIWLNEELVFMEHLPINSDSSKIAKMRDSAETILKNLKSLK